MAIKGMRYLKYRVSVLSFPSPQQLSDTGFLYYKGAVLRETTNETCCSIFSVQLGLRLRTIRGVMKEKPMKFIFQSEPYI
jgi:hypothetical protein